MQFQVSICCNTLVSDEILKNIFSAKFRRILSFLYFRYPERSIFLQRHFKSREKSGCINEETENENSSGDDIPSSITQQWLEGNLTNVNKSLCPAISYWVALTTINGAPASPISVHKALLNCGLDVTATQVMKLFSFFLITQAFP